MARLINGIFGGHVVGRLGEFSFSYSAKNGQQVRLVRKIDPEEFATSPAYRSRRKYCAEFGRAATSVKVLSDALGELVGLRSDLAMNARLIKKMIAALREDKTNEIGLRKPTDGDLSSLQDFQFNPGLSKSCSFFKKIGAKIDRASGLLSIDLPSFIPAETIPVPKTASFFRVVSSGLAIDFENKKYSSDTRRSELLLLNQRAPGITLSNILPVRTVLPLILVAGIEYYGRRGELMEGGFLAIVKVEGTGQ